MIKKLRTNFFEEEGAGSGGTVEYVTMTDPETQAEVRVPKALESFIGHVASANRKGGRRTATEKLEEITNQYEAAKDELDQLREKMKSATGNKQVEALKSEYDKIVADLKKKADEHEKSATTYKTKLEQRDIEADIYAALSEYDLFNSQQTANILRQIGNARRVEGVDLATGQGNGKVNTVMTINVTDETGAAKPVDLSPAEAVKIFLAQPENAFHLKNKLTPGAGTTGSNYTGDRSKIGQLEKQLAEAEKSGAPLEVRVGLKQQIYEESQQR